MREVLLLLLKHKGGALGACILAVTILLAVIADLIVPYDPYWGDLEKALQPPSWEHPLGTDEQGRDLLSRIIYGARFSLLIAFASVALGVALGVPLGLISGYLGGWVDFLLQRIAEILLTLPGILLALALVSILGPGLLNVIVAVGIGFVPVYIRLVRGVVLQIKNMEYVQAAEMLGVSRIKIMLRHILPNALPTIMVQATLHLGVAVLGAAGLGFLGLGIQPPNPEWGTMIGTGKSYIFYAPHLVIFPGLALFTVVLGFNLLGTALREILDPRLRGE